MQRLVSRISIGAAALLLSASLALAQSAPQAPAAAAPKAPAAAAPAATAPKGVPKKASTPEGIECSKQADEKKLHGKERKTFRAKCVRDLKKAAAAAKAPPAAKKN
jgi:anti-sigma28 factor (negative regulator of flagellin synthesis)